jgi:predicted amidophosphoribosyltransferase
VPLCANCGNAVAGKFCTKCGAAVDADRGPAPAVPMPICRRCKNTVAGRYCSTCGTALNEDARETKD